ncbi:MAG: glycosyltransferase [Nitratireductor sp.]|nr:glycosyltransferase [Nitratireductor sp.]
MNDDEKVHHDVVVMMPVYEDRASAVRLMRDIADVLTGPVYVVAIEDGSTLNRLQACDIEGSGLRGEVVVLARNVGHQRAIATGLAHVARTMSVGKLAVMDSDGEDSPGDLPVLLDRVDGGVDVVFASRRRRSESLAFRTFYVIYRLLFQLLTGRVIQFGNFAAMNGLAVRRLSVMQECWVHFAAAIMVSRLSIATVPVDRGSRYGGTSKMNFVTLVLHGMRSVMVFAEDVLVRMGLLCAALFVAAAIGIPTAIALKLAGMATPGWLTSAAGLLIVILIQAGILTLVTLMVLGVVRSAPPVTDAGLDTLIARIERADEARDESGRRRQPVPEGAG